MVRGERYISLSGAVGTIGVRELLHAYRGQPREVKDHADRALVRGWKALSGLLQNGGAINIHGDILVVGASNLNLPNQEFHKLQEKCVIGVRPWRFSKWSYIDSRMPLDWGDKNWGVQLISDKFVRSLGYTLSSNNRAVFSLILDNGEVRSERDFRILRSALGEHMVQSYARERVARVIAPGIAVTQLLVDIANTAGRNRVSISSMEKSRMESRFDTCFDY